MRKYVLVVDDDQVFVQLLFARLEKAGYTVTWANDAEQMVIQAESLKPSLILSDVKMPVWGSGVDAFKRLQMSSSTRNIPVVFLTGLPQAEAQRLVPKNPRVRLVSKPVDWILLRTAIRELTGVDRPL